MTPSRPTLIAAVVAVAVLWLGGPVAAHTVADVVAVPAGSRATVVLQPGHGCDGSPTARVSIRAPMRGATAGEVVGWTATAIEDEDGTVLDWTGGTLPGARSGFPVSFTAPDTPGQLLAFPTVQVCESGEELAWISGDPSAGDPAPRLLVLPAGAAPAADLGEVPLDAPGRDQLTEIVDVDAPAATDGDGPTAGGGVAAADAGGSAVAAAGAAADTGGDGGDAATAVVVIVVIAALGAVTAVVVLRRRSPRPQ